MKHRGFSLLDVMMAVAIVGIAVTAILGLVTSQTVAVRTTSQICEAIHLANNIHEYALTLPVQAGGGETPTTTATDPKNFNNVCQLDGWNSGSAGPISSNADRITTLSGWQQACTVKAFDLTDPRPSAWYNPSDGRTTNANLRILTVTVTYQNKPMYVCRWILAPTVQYGFN